MQSIDTQPWVAIVTLNWNRPDDTLEFLASVTTQTYPHTTIIVVDNGSTDDSVVRINQTFPNVTMLCNLDNQGFAKGANRGIRYAMEAGADYVFLVNNDTILSPDTLEHLLAHVADDVAITTPIIYYASKPDKVWSLGGKCHSLTLEKTGDSAKTLARVEKATTLERDYVVGCAILLSRFMIEKIGLFDEQFFMYYEDMDLSLRIRRAGLRILLVPAAKMWHKVSASSGGSNSPAERYWMARSSVLFFRKHACGLQRVIIPGYRFASAVRTVTRLIRNKRYPSAQAYLRGLYDGLRTSL